MVCCFLDTPYLHGLGDPRIRYVSKRCESCEKGLTVCPISEYVLNVRCLALDHSFNTVRTVLEAASFPLTSEDYAYLFSLEEVEQAIDASSRDGEDCLAPSSVVDASPHDGKTYLAPSSVIEAKTDDETFEAVFRDEAPLPSKDKGKKKRYSPVLDNKSREESKEEVDRMTPLLFNYSDAEERKILGKKVSVVDKKKASVIVNKKPSALVNKPSVIVNKKPSVIVNKKPSVIVNKKPSVIINKKPSVIVNKKPSVIVNKKPRVIVDETRSVIVNHPSASEQKTQENRPSKDSGVRSHKPPTVIVNNSGKSKRVPDINSIDQYPRPRVGFGFMSGFPK